MNKRGVGSVVATVLIVLLVVVGVGVLWGAVRPLIGSVGDRVQPDCLTVDLDVMSCVYSAEVSGTCSISGASCTGIVQGSCPSSQTCDNYVPATTIVSVRRGVGRADIRAVKFAFSFDNSDSLITPEIVTSVGELETFTSSLGGFPSVGGVVQAPQLVIVVPMVGENKFLCTPNVNPFPCISGP